jgi:hypothetical protein
MQAATDESEATAQSTTEQQPTLRRFYIDMQGIQSQINAKAFDIQLVAGRPFHALTKSTPNDLKKFCMEMRFSSLAEAMNTLSSRGWQLSQCYVTNINGTTVTHWIIYKDVQDPMELLTGLISEK